MRLIDLLGALDDESIERLSERHLGSEEPESRASVCVNLEGELKAPKHVRDAIYNLQPPAFVILCELLEAPDQTTPLAGMRERALEQTRILADQVSTGTVAGRQEMRLYRRVLVEARRSDLELDPSETALLRVLRRELEIRQVDHFLIEHHEELRQFWDTDHGFLDAVNGLRSGGLAFAVEGHLVFPSDLVPLARQVLGIETSAAARRRLFGRVSGQELAEALGGVGAKTSGSKEEKIQRAVENYVQVSDVLAVLSLASLKDLCKALEMSVSGAKDDLGDRLLKAFASDKDLVAGRRVEEPPAPPPEPRVLEPAAFDALLAGLRQQDLSDILSGIGASRITGSKEQLTRLIRESRFSEASLLLELGSKQLESALDRQRLKTSGAKRERIDRLLEWFASNAEAAAPASVVVAVGFDPAGTDIFAADSGADPTST